MGKTERENKRQRGKQKDKVPSFSLIAMAILVKASSTLVESLAEVSRKFKLS